MFLFLLGSINLDELLDQTETPPFAAGCFLAVEKNFVAIHLTWIFLDGADLSRKHC